MVRNGDFEQNLKGWSASGKPKPSVVETPVHGGSKGVLLGKTTSPRKGESTLKQTVIVPSGSPHLTFWYQPTCGGALGGDHVKMLVKSTKGSTLATVLDVCETADSYQQVDYDMSAFAGRKVVLFFSNVDDGTAGQATYCYLDDVALG